jgi:hypothetical protein
MEQDPYDLEIQARTEAALAAERDFIDAAASEDAIQFKDTEREALREELGYSLAWWAEDDNIPTLDIAVAQANDACGRAQFIRTMQEHGYPEDALTGYVPLNSLTGPLVVSGLQVLGTIHPHLRDEVTKILRTIAQFTPVATEEEEAAAEAANASYSEKMLENFKASMGDAGITVLSLDEAAEMFGNDEADPGFEADLN